LVPQTIANGEETVSMEHFRPNVEEVEVTDALVDRLLLRLHQGQPSSGELYSPAADGPARSRADGLLTGDAFGLRLPAARQLLSDLAKEGTIEATEYKNAVRKTKSGYVVRRWPRGKPPQADAQLGGEAPF
jgi:hypothetical protein